MSYQEHQDLVFAPDLQEAVQPFPLDALSVTDGNVTISERMTFGRFRPCSVGVGYKEDTRMYW